MLTTTILLLEGFEFIGLSKTHAFDQLITDSAASGTAMASGVKTYNGVLELMKKISNIKAF